MKIDIVNKDNDRILRENVFPDVIKNRFDILHSDKKVNAEGGGMPFTVLKTNGRRHIFPSALAEGPVTLAFICGE